MSHSKLLLSITLLLTAIFCLNAEPTIVRPPRGIKNRIPLKDEKHARPNGEFEMSDEPECVFIDGILQFTFPRSEGMAKVTVTETQTGNVNRMSALTLYPFEMTVGCRPGYYVIMVNTAKGSCYVGEYIIEE